MDNAEMKAQLIDYIDVLDKLKELFLIPGLEMMTTKQVVEFYEVDVTAIQRCYQRNIVEIRPDGISGINAGRFSHEHAVVVKSGRGSTIFENNGTEFSLPNSNNTFLFSKRAVLRIGMLLRDSVVALEIRHQLLNNFENSTPAQRHKEIDTVKYISEDFFIAMMGGDIEGVGKAMVALSAHKDRHIAVLNEQVEVVTAENEALATKNEVLVVENDVDFEETIDSCALNIDD